MAKPDCKETGRVVPLIDPTKCEGKEDCVRVCPENVFEMYLVPSDEKARLPLGARLKLWVHGGRQAKVARGQDCKACSLCVTACPEKAIKLTAFRAQAP